MSIRFKVILPYLILTLLVAVTGVYVLTNLVTGTLSERLTNQLLEAGRVVLDDMVRQEVGHIESARLMAYTVGVPDALEARSSDRLSSLVMPTVSGSDVENLFIYDGQGEPKLHLVRLPDGGVSELSAQGTSTLGEIAAAILAENDPTNSLPRRTLDINPVNQKRYYYTAIPVPSDDNDETVGVIIVGTSIDTLLEYFRSTSFANIILYEFDGEAYATTFAQSDEEAFLSTMDISPTLLEEIRDTYDVVGGENIEVDGRSYRLARGELQVADSKLGIFAVALPLQFVIESGSNSRSTYVLLFTVAMVFVVLVGYLIARLIINPLSSLADTSKAITAGDLTKRSGIESRDEIGTLAHSFDEMTSRLQIYTAELERTNQMLEQMDQTKASFIHVAAHELRTPLTLINGFSQVLQGEANSSDNLKTISRGIREGSERMALIVDNMLDISKIDSQVLQIVPKPVQLDAVISETVKRFGDALVERNLTMTKKGLASLPSIMADHDLIQKAFYHLIINAIKYTPDGGKITIYGRTLPSDADPTDVEVVIRDTGIGIEKEHQELIFEKFYQTGEVILHSTGKTNFKGGGPGLGLAITKGIIEAHHGQVWVESPGHDEETFPGSMFHVRLPLEQSS